jgi:hypothetical protein
VTELQQLDVVARLFPLVLSGEKTSTIRWREATIVPGLMRYVNAGDRARNVVVMVTGCARMPLHEAAAYLGREDEWPDAVMLDGMREHYPSIELHDMVDIVEHLTPHATAIASGSAQ